MSKVSVLDGEWTTTMTITKASFEHANYLIRLYQCLIHSTKGKLSCTM